MKVIIFFKRSIRNLLILIIITFSISILLYSSAKPISCLADKKNAIYGNYSPECTLSGNYLPSQKWKALKYSWCVTSDGIIIPETYKKITTDTNENDSYYKRLRFNECINIRNNLNINQRIIVIMGKIFNPYVS